MIPSQPLIIRTYRSPRDCDLLKPRDMRQPQHIVANTPPEMSPTGSRPVTSHSHGVHDHGSNPKRTPKRLILALDGTGNSFQGNTSDTNIVKLYDMLDRNHPQQLHYYQPGIGTYTPYCSVNTGWFGRIQRNISQTIDAGLATSFDAHVIAGYRFIMRYYKTGDQIYMFGFSRGAFTARFLARMISHVGLLSEGNEEMVPFAYKVYQDYETGVQTAPEYMRLFKKSFCREECKLADSPLSDDESGIKVHFLGLFDCVNSVGTFDVPFGRRIPLPKVQGTARHIRHAVAIDERRVKFKPALFAQDIYQNPREEDIKEVWFPGGHCDIGGGYRAQLAADAALGDEGEEECNHAHEDKEHDRFQLSDIALKWMIDQVDNISGTPIAWNLDQKCSFLERFERNKRAMIQARIHDSLSYGEGLSWTMVMFWKFIEFCPLIKRWEYINLSEKEAQQQQRKQNWSYVRFPLNAGARRDVPPGALFHHAVLQRLRLFVDYKPTNEMWVKGQKCNLCDTSTIAEEESRQQVSVGLPHFNYDASQSVGSVEVGSQCRFTQGVSKEDGIYTVMLDKD